MRSPSSCRPRLEDNQPFAARNTNVPSLLQGLAACQACGYAYYRTSTRTATRRLYYYRCLGSDDYRYPGGRRCANLPVRRLPRPGHLGPRHRAAHRPRAHPRRARPPAGRVAGGQSQLRERMPTLRAKEQTLRAQLDALEAQLVDQETYLKLAETLEGFLARLRGKADPASVPERQRVLRLLVKFACSSRRC